MPDGTTAGLVRAAADLVLPSVVSQPIVDEWRRSFLKREVEAYFRRRGTPISTLARLVNELVQASEFIVPTGEAPACRDEKDRIYLHCCVAGDADFLVTTDLDMLVLLTVGRTQIVRPGHLWRVLSEG